MLQHVLAATLFPHPQGGQFAKQTATFYIPALAGVENKAAELNEVLCRALGVADAPAIYARLSNPDGSYEYAAITAGSAMEWLMDTAGQQQPEDDSRWQDGRPALWVKVPQPPAAGPTATASCCSAAAAAAARSTPASSSSGQPEPITATGGTVHKRRGKQAAVGDTEVSFIGG